MKNNEFKIKKSKDETIYVLECASGGGTSAGAVASVPGNLGAIRRRVQELKDKVVGQPRRANHPLGKSGAGTHTDKKKQAQQVRGQKHKNKDFEEARRYGGDFPRYWGDMDVSDERAKRAFKRRELQHELGHEDEWNRQQAERPVLIGMFFYDIKPEQASEASAWGIKQTKSGRFGMAVYDKSGSNTAWRKKEADKKFGPGKWWSKDKAPMPELFSMPVFAESWKSDTDPVSSKQELARQRREKLSKQAADATKARADARKIQQQKDKEKANEGQQKFEVSCSQCGQAFMRDKKEGFSHCKDHKGRTAVDESQDKQSDNSEVKTCKTCGKKWKWEHYCKGPKKDAPKDEYMESLANALENVLGEKIPHGASVDYYIQDFAKSSAPQFKGKTKEKKRQMAIAAYYNSRQPKGKKKK